MGMGEPTMNIDAVLAACERLPDLGVTHRRTAISTVGWVPGIDRLAECEMPVSLALSLHAPNDGLRSQLMPVNDRYPLAEVLAACDRYRARRRRKVFVEYVMLDGVNDLPEHARELAALLDPRVYKVNLIPYNPTGAYDGSSPERIERFRAILAEHRLTATVRLTRGQDIDAACGQLAAAATALSASEMKLANQPVMIPAMATVDTSAPVVGPPQMSANPLRRVWRPLRRVAGARQVPARADRLQPRPHPPDRPRPAAAAARRLRRARADLQHAAAALAGHLHARPGGKPLRHRRPPRELPLA